MNVVEPLKLVWTAEQKVIVFDLEPCVGAFSLLYLGFFLRGCFHLRALLSKPVLAVSCRQKLSFFIFVARGVIGASSALLHYLCCITDPCPACLWSTPAECLQSQIIVLKLLLIVSLSALNIQHICAPDKLIRSCLHVVESGPRCHLPWWFHLPAEYTIEFMWRSLDDVCHRRYWS